MMRNWNAVYDVLVEECGALDYQSCRDMFLNTANTPNDFYTNNRGFHEYRFQGTLGFGGKLLMIVRANARLKEL